MSTSSRGSDAWLGVEPRHLATFAAVAHSGSFRAAASRFGYVQSAVSQQIAHLERALQSPLIERGKGKRPLCLTPSGEALLEHAERVVQQVRAACADVACMTGSAPLRLAVEPSAIALLPGLVQRLAAAHPGAALAVVEAPSASLAELVADCTVDLALGAAVACGPQIEQRVLRVDPWALVAAAGSTLDALGSIGSLGVLRGARLIENGAHPAPFDADELGVVAVTRCDRPAIALELVRGGAGIAILPAMAVEDPGPDLDVFELEAIPPRMISVMWAAARRLPALAHAFDDQPVEDERADDAALLAVA